MNLARRMNRCPSPVFTSPLKDIGACNPLSGKKEDTVLQANLGACVRPVWAQASRPFGCRRPDSMGAGAPTVWAQASKQFGCRRPDSMGACAQTPPLARICNQCVYSR